MAGATQPSASWATLLEELRDRIACRFVRPEPRKRALSYVKALISATERKNGWTIAEAVGDASPDGVQRLLSAASWDSREVRDDLREYVVDHLGDERSGVMIVDETSFPKKGKDSVGVGHQYCGIADGVENCQVGVFVCYASEKGAALIDRALYLPKYWAKDYERRARAGVPEEVRFVTKPDLAVGMLARTFLEEVPARWVAADALYGSSLELRLFLENRGQPFVLGVKSNDRVWKLSERGRLLERESLHVRVDELAGELPADQWRRLSAGEGSKDERPGDWALVELESLQITGWDRSRSYRHWGRWLLVRRSVTDPKQLSYYVVFAPKEDTSMREFVQIAGARWTVECCFKEAKGLGLDEYEVRKWDGWYRHITLTLLAHAFVSVVRSHEASGEEHVRGEDLVPLTLPEVRRLMCSVLLKVLSEQQTALCWSRWRRKHQLRAKLCHKRRRGTRCA